MNGHVRFEIIPRSQLILKKKTVTQVRLDRRTHGHLCSYRERNPAGVAPNPEGYSHRYDWIYDKRIVFQRLHANNTARRSMKSVAARIKNVELE